MSQNKQKIAIWGANGMLGRYVKNQLANTYDVISFTRKDLDLKTANFQAISLLLSENNIGDNDIVINCAGVIPQSSNQRTLDTRTYFEINSIFPIMLSNVCNHIGAKLIHITTDCVFSGKGENSGNYTENSTHDETNDYGISKSLGECCDNTTIIRTSIIGEELCHKRSLLEWVKKNTGKSINGFADHLWNGVTCLKLAQVIDEIIQHNYYWKGVRHIFSPRSVSKYELVSMINEIYDLNITITKTTSEQNIDKTISTVFDANQYFNIPDLHQQIKELREFLLVP